MHCRMLLLKSLYHSYHTTHFDSSTTQIHWDAVGGQDLFYIKGKEVEQSKLLLIRFSKLIDYSNQKNLHIFFLLIIKHLTNHEQYTSCSTYWNILVDITIRKSNNFSFKPRSSIHLRFTWKLFLYQENDILHLQPLMTISAVYWINIVSIFYLLYRLVSWGELAPASLHSLSVFFVSSKPPTVPL